MSLVRVWLSVFCCSVGSMQGPRLSIGSALTQHSTEGCFFFSRYLSAGDFNDEAARPSFDLFWSKTSMK